VTGTYLIKKMTGTPTWQDRRGGR